MLRKRLFARRRRSNEIKLLVSLIENDEAWRQKFLYEVLARASKNLEASTKLG
jgi:hypothetical protein